MAILYIYIVFMQN